MDYYHETNPPTELKSAVMGRENSQKKKSVDEADGGKDDELLAIVRSKMIVAAVNKINKNLPVRREDAKYVLHTLGIPTTPLSQRRRLKTRVVLRCNADEIVTRAFAC